MPCQVCNQNVSDSPDHVNTKIHRMNLLLRDWESFKKQNAKNREGLEVIAEIEDGNNYKLTDNDHRTTFIVQSSLNNFKKNGASLSLKLTIKNQRSTDVYLVDVFKMFDLKFFTLVDPLQHIESNSIINLKPKASYKLILNFKMGENVSPSTYKIPLAFAFQWFKKFPLDIQCMTIIKEVLVIIGEISRSVKTVTPFTNHAIEMEKIQASTDAKRRQQTQFSIPLEYVASINLGLNNTYELTNVENGAMNDIMQKLEAWRIPNTNRYIANINYYVENMQFLLWADETGLGLQLQKYNMENVKVQLFCADTLRIKVPGLSEKRPSLLQGDIVRIKPHNETIGFEGIIFRIDKNNIYIKELQEDIFKFVANPEETFDISFTYSRVSYIREHHGILGVEKKNLFSYLFPNPEIGLNLVLPIKRPQIINKDIGNNQEQFQAVQNILNNTARNAPYVVFGPPGTGKTATLVEAILQIVMAYPKKKILICAPSNSACDNIAIRLIHSPFHLTRNQLVRIYSVSRDLAAIPEVLKYYSNLKNDMLEHWLDIPNKFKIVITTLVHIGKYRDFYPDVVIIDEAAQAKESEVCIPISRMRNGCQLVLAGDPKQLGPICVSKIAIKYGLSVSILKRLISTNTLYSQQHPNFLSMLKQNYRSHFSILHVPNMLFYGGELKAMSHSAHNDPVSYLSFYNIAFSNVLLLGFPIEFCCVYSKEEQEGSSPSFFNHKEIEVVVHYIEALFRMPDVNVRQEEIGIITPYIRQMYKIKQALSQYPGIEVGTTEVFQGREKRIIIISTVRAQHSLLLHDKRYNLGFVSNEERFNVAITRAIAKLVIIGNPLVLGTDKNWSALMEQCQSNNSLYGAYIPPRNAATIHMVTQLQNKVRNKNPVIQKQSVR